MGAIGRVSGDRGSVGLELALGLGLLVLPVAMLVAVFPGWAERTAMARVAAQEAARIAVLADDPDDGEIAGVAFADQIARNHGVPAQDLTTTVLVPRDPDGSPARGGEASATVSVVIRLPELALTGGAKAFSWSVTHAERIDDYRSFP